MAVAMDTETSGWTRRFDDPNVVKRREDLVANAGIPDLPVIDGNLIKAGDEAEIARAVELYVRDGCAYGRNPHHTLNLRDVSLLTERLLVVKVVAMSDALSPEQLEFARGGVDRNIAEFMESDPHMGGRYTGRWGLEPGRYSFGSGRHLHEKEWCMLITLPTCTPIVRAIYGSDDYFVWGAGGDFSLAGAVEYQPLHRDGGFYEGPAQGVTLNFNSQYTKPTHTPPPQPEFQGVLTDCLCLRLQWSNTRAKTGRSGRSRAAIDGAATRRCQTRSPST